MRILAVIVSIATVAEGAHAAGSDATAAALKKYEEARAAFDANQLDVALAKFKASYELLPSPNSRLYIGRCYRGLARPASAYVELELAAREAQDRVAAGGEKRYEATRAAAAAEAAAIAPLVPRVTFEVAADAPADLVVTQNGETVPRAAWGTPLEVDPGEVVVEARASRAAPFVERFILTPGERRRVLIALARLPSAAAAERPAAGPGADGAAAAAPPAGSRTLVPRAVARGSAIGAAAAGVAALAAAAGLTVDAERRNDAELAKSPYSRTPDARNTIRGEAIAGSVLFAAGGVLVAASGALTYFGWRQERARRLSIAPALSATTAALVVGGSF